MSLPDSPSAKNAVRTNGTNERRRHQRRKPRQLVFIDVGEDTGGLVLDVSEGGVCFQGVSSVGEGEILKLRFKLPRTSISIRAEGQFIRAGISQKGGALRFLHVPPEVRMQLREWIALAGRAESRSSSEPDVVTVLAAEPGISHEEPRADGEGPTRLSSIWAQPIAKSGQATAPALSQGQSRLEASASSQLTIKGTSQATNKPIKIFRNDVPSRSAKQQRPVRGWQMSHFTAGIVVGCVVIATAGGGLIATGRLRLVRPSSAPAIAVTAEPAASNVEAITANVEGQSPVISEPTPSAAATEQAPVRPAATSVPAPAAATPAPAAPVRTQKAAVQEKFSNAQRSAPIVETATPPEPTREPEAASPAQPEMSQPAVQNPATPERVEAPAPSLPAGASQSLPEAGSHTPAVVTQSNAPTAKAETFASVKMEERPTRVRVSQTSTPVFAAPDPNGAKPSSIEPATLVQYVEPVYPAAARAAKIQGSVDILATVGKDGVPRSFQAVSGDPQLAAAAIAAISNWRYRPAILNGQFEESLITITLKFTL